MANRRVSSFDQSESTKLLGEGGVRLDDGGEASPRAVSPKPLPTWATRLPTWVCHLALAAVQTCFVLGAVYLKWGLSTLTPQQTAEFHPLLFVFFRTASAGPVLFAAAVWMTGQYLPARGDALRVALLGVFLFLNQGLYILGLNLSGALVASCLQPAIPVFTHMLAVASRYETSSLRKGAGIALAVGGAVSMVMGSASKSVGGAAAAAAKQHSSFLGGVCLVGNTLSMAAYFITAKGLTRGYPPVCLTSWAYLGASACLAVAVGVSCPPADFLRLPPPLVGPLVFWILLCSIFCYLTLMVATSLLPPSEVAAYQTLQPMLGAALSVIVLHETPTWWDLGALGVVAGMLLVTTSFGRDAAAAAAAADR